MNTQDDRPVRHIRLGMFAWIRSSVYFCTTLALLSSTTRANDLPAAAEPDAAAKVDARPETTGKKPGKVASLPWSDSLAKVLAQAQRDRRPILARGEGAACPFCRIMAKELVLPQVQRELQRWNLVAIDVDKSEADAGKLAISAIPAFRILTPAGKLVASHDGVLTADKLTEWLKEHFEAAGAVPDTELATTGEPDSKTVFKLIGMFRNREATVREAAIRRLLPYPDSAAVPVVAAFTEGTLSTRLVALELLREWQAPIAELDPWRAETLTETRLKTLTDWAATAKRKPVEPDRPLSANEIAETSTMLDRLVQADLPEASAIRERLARFGKRLLPEVAARIKTAATDEARQQLTALRYRLVATDALVITWPGGIDRLAATDANIRQQATDELTRHATSAEEPLLLELFSDPSPLVRELSLRALRTVGAASVNSALVNILSDPEPNVRAAVLKQLAEEPSTALVSKIVVYVLAEKDSDLVVHAIRVLGELSGEKLAVEALKKLLVHESWRVRAEAIEALGKSAEKSNRGNTANATNADTYVKIIDLLKDSDGFVVSRAINVLTKADLAAAVAPLVEVAKVHPELAPEVVKALSQARSQQAQTIPQIKTFLSHANPKVRSAAIEALSQLVPNTIDQELRAGLQDADTEVRIAAANGVFSVLNRQRITMISVSDDSEPTHPRNTTRVILDPQPQPQPTGLLGGLMQILAPSTPRAIRVVKPMKQPDTKPAAATKSNSDPGTPNSKQPNSTLPEKAKPDDGPAKRDPNDVQADPVIEPKAAAPSGVTPARRDGDSTSTVTEITIEKSSAPEKQVDEVEQALLKIREGKSFDKKWFALVEVLKPLLTQQRAEERVSGALALIALGQDQLALPVLEQVLASDPGLTSRVASALPWALAVDRQRLFDEILKRTPTLEELRYLIYSLGTLRSPQTESLLWALAGDARMDATTADGVRDAMFQYYLHQYSYNIQQAAAKKKARAIAAAITRSKVGTAWQRLIALAILVPLDAAIATENAQLLLKDGEAESAFRADALQIMLTTMPSSESRPLALAQLESDVPAVRTRALEFLVFGRQHLPALQNGQFDISQGNIPIPAESRTKGVPITPEPPSGVTVEQLLPLLKSNSPQDAALAGYVLVLLDHPEGLPPLLEYWRQHRRDNVQWMRLVYRAVAHLDDVAEIGTLKDIFELLIKNKYYGEQQMPEFYWTIRIMTGPEILSLRKSMRTEFGAERLNQ